MDKKIFLLDREYYSEGFVSTLTEKDLESFVSKEDYEDNDTIIKIDANGYESVEAALDDALLIMPEEYYYIISFGF